MRLIDADELYQEAENRSEKMNGYFNELSRVITAWDINHAPTVDAVQVVRCKDCISSYEFGDLETGEKIRYCQRLRDYWTKDELWVNDDCFCCWGRKRNDVETR